MKISETWMMRLMPNADEVDAVDIVTDMVHTILDKFDPEENSTVLSSVETGECFSIKELRRAISIISYMGENHAWEIEALTE